MRSHHGGRQQEVVSRCRERVRLDARINRGYQTEGRPRLLGYADQAGSLTKREITKPSLAETTVAEGTETLGLCPAPESAFAYPAALAWARRRLDRCRRRDWRQGCSLHGTGLGA